MSVDPRRRPSSCTGLPTHSGAPLEFPKRPMTISGGRRDHAALPSAWNEAVPHEVKGGASLSKPPHKPFSAPEGSAQRTR